MATRHKDEQIRIRIERLTATSAANQRFVEQYDDLVGNVRMERHIDIVRMGQMMFEMGISKEIDFMDNDAWATMTTEQRLARFFDVLAREGKVPVLATETTGLPVDISRVIADLLPAKTVVEDKPSHVSVAEPKIEPTVVEPEPDLPPAPQVDSEGHQQDVITTEDGGTIITQKATIVKKGAIKGLGNVGG